MNSYYVLVFENTHNAIAAESVLKERNIKNIIMPTPTFITKSCGISIKIDKDDIEKIKPIVNEKCINIKNMYYKTKDKYDLFNF